MEENQPLRPALKQSYSATTQDDFHCHDDVDSKDNLSNSKARRILWLSVGICLFFMACEVVGGLLANSLAIVTDAAHLATDFASMLISLFSLYIAARPPSRRMSFGFHRAEVLGAFFSVFLIWIVTGFLVYAAVDRIIRGEHEVDAPIMAITAALGVLVNLIMGALLYFGGHTHSHGFGGHQHGHSHDSNDHSHDDTESEDSADHSPNINVRAAFIHVLGDLIQSVGVLFAALLIFFFPNLTILDPICTLLFSIIVLGTTIYILRDAMVVLLEGRPSNIDFAKVITSLENIDGVRKVHDLRIWALTMDKVAVSAHLEVADPAASQTVLKTTRAMLRREFGVHECTVQIETFRDTDCGKCDMPVR